MSPFPSCKPGRYGSLILVVDNTAAVDVANNMGVTARTKHFDMCIHYFRDLVQYGRITPVHVLTMYQRADGFTKGLDKKKFIEWCESLFTSLKTTVYKGVS